MYSKITLNNTDRKEIGVPILKRTNKMITDFDLDYERYYKIDKQISQREIEYQEFLKRQEQHQFYLKNLIKILRIYFKQYNYNSDTYYKEYRASKNYKKRKKIKRTKSLILSKNKAIYNIILKNSQIFKLFKPYMYPLGAKDKKIYLLKKINTEKNVNLKTRLVRMTQDEIKKYAEMFGVIPINYIKKDDKDKNKKKHKKQNTKKLISYYTFLRNNYDSKSYDNKTHLLLQKGMKIKEKFFGGFETMKKYIYMKNSNSNNLTIKSYERKIKSSYGNKFRLVKRNNYTNKMFYNKSNNNNCFTSKADKLKKIILPQNYYKNKNNNRYLDLKKNVHIINRNLFKKINASNITSLNSISSFNRFPFTKKEYSKNFDINDLKFKLKEKITPKNLLNFRDNCSETIKQSKLLSKDINFLNKILTKSKTSFKQAKKIIKDNTENIDMLKLVKNDIFAQRRKKLQKFKYIKENMSGNLKVNFKNFIRKSHSELDFVNAYNRRREIYNCFKNDSEISDKSEEEEEKVNIYSYIKRKKNFVNK